ncbi:MAG: hypothetical protein AAGH46_11115, partial [Bacteroidota bacterium]
IEVSKITNLKAPTDQRIYDGASTAILTIVKDKKSWVSSGFDDGYPPKEIADLVEKLLTLEESVLAN